MTETRTTTAWAGFWRRVLAFVIDGILLGVAGYAAGSLFHDTLSAMDGPTRLIGLAAGLLYFGILSSGAGGSRTPGMRLMGLKVVAVGGRPLGLPASLWRALVLQAPLMLNGTFVQIDDPVWAYVYSTVAIVLVFGVTLAQIILLLFNLPSRRLAHDLLSGSAVVRTTATDVPGVTSRRATWAAAIVVLLVLAAQLGLTVSGLDLTPKSFNPLFKAQAAVATLPGVMSVSVQDNTTTVWGGSKPEATRTLIVTARVRAWPKDETAFVRRVGETVTGAYRLAPGQGIRVVLTNGFDIGIAQGWRSSSTPYEPAPPPKPPAPTAPAAAAIGT